MGSKEGGRSFCFLLLVRPCRDLSPVPRADKVVSGDGEHRLEEEGGPGGGVEGEGPDGAVDVVCPAVPGQGSFY